MSCFLEEGESGRQNAVLIFKREQLLYDIGNYAYIEGSVMSEVSDHNRHMVQDAVQDGNVDRITRVLDLAMAKCRETLYAYTRHNIHRAELDDRRRETPTYGIVLSVPTDFSQTTLNLLEKLIHEHLVCEALADWMSLTNPAKAAIWKQKADDAIDEVRASLLTRMSRVRIRKHPF